MRPQATPSPARPLSDRTQVLAAYRNHVNRGLASLATLTAAPVEYQSRGAIVWASDGTRYLNCGGYGVFLLGHQHPRVLAAVTEQLQRHSLSVRGVLEPRLAEACTALASVAPAGLEYVTLTNSGAEATELALKLARANGRRRVVAMDRGFHGKTLGALSITGRPEYRAPAGPLLPDVSFVPFGDAGALAAELDSNPAPAAVIVEPVQGEGGVILPPIGYLTELQHACKQHDALLIVDEIQTGLGRTGQWWGCNRDSITPDILLVGKILSGGLVPAGAVVATPEVFDVLNANPLLHTSTYGGNPLASAAAIATIEVLEDENLVQRAATLGSRLLAATQSILTETADPHLIRDIRGQGLMIGLDCTAPSVAAELYAALLARGVITSYSLNASSVLRLTPPAILDETHIDWLLTALHGAISELSDNALVRTSNITPRSSHA